MFAERPCAGSPVRVAAPPMPITPAIPPSEAVPTPPAALAHQLAGRSGAKLNRCHLGRCGHGSGLGRYDRESYRPRNVATKARILNLRQIVSGEATGAPINRA